MEEVKEYKTNEVLENYNNACNDVVKAFSERYEVNVSEEDWVAGEVGGAICINEEFFVGMEILIIMLKNNVPWEEFLRWWDYNMDANLLGLNTINFVSWLTGAPRLSKEQLDGLKEKRKELTDLVEKYKKEF